jgi:hypothetical protein
MSTPKPVDSHEQAEAVQRRLKYFVWLFAVLFATNIVFSNHMAQEIFAESRRYQTFRAVAPKDETERLDNQLAGRGHTLLVFNFPALVNIGLALRSRPPALGAGYYPTMVLGATYMPFFFVFLLFFLVHSPARYGRVPGVDLNR